MVGEFDKYLHDELDLMREAANGSQLRRNFAGSKLLHVPEMFWDYCSEAVIVMERVSGIPIGRIDELRAAGINLKKLSRDGVEIFFTQVFKHGFFHADMHPGNIYVGDSGVDFNKYIAIDFGIVGTLTDVDKNYLAQNFLAFFHRDYKRVAVLHVESGWVPKGTRIDELESAIRATCEPVFDLPLARISLGQVLLRLFQTSRRFNVEIQPQLVLLQKTLLNIEGLGRQLDPELDLWSTAQPFPRKVDARPARLARLPRPARAGGHAVRDLRAADAAAAASGAGQRGREPAGGGGGGTHGGAATNAACPRRRLRWSRTDGRRAARVGGGTARARALALVRRGR